MTAAQRDRKQEIVVVDPAVTVVIERWKVLDQLEPALLEDAEIEQRVDALDLTADPERVRATHERRGVSDLQARLLRRLRHAEGCTRLDAREGVLRQRRGRLGVVEIRADAGAQGVDRRRSAARPGAEHSVV